MSSAILTPNFPTHVPPNFCTSHLASGSIVFWCRFGGVLGGEGDNEDDLEDNEDGVDIIGRKGGVTSNYSCQLKGKKKILSLTRRTRDDTIRADSAGRFFARFRQIKIKRDFRPDINVASASITVNCQCNHWHRLASTTIPSTFTSQHGHPCGNQEDTPSD